MLYQGNGSESVSGVYERERLRRRARKLGLRLVKTNQRRSEYPDHSTAQRSGTHPDPQRDSANAVEKKVLETEFDKCG